jgi:hypothetical protein
VHSKHKEGCQDKGLASATQTNPSFAQREHGDGIILPSDSIAVTVRVYYCAYKEEDALGIISNDIN